MFYINTSINRNYNLTKIYQKKGEIFVFPKTQVANNITI